MRCPRPAEVIYRVERRLAVHGLVSLSKAGKTNRGTFFALACTDMGKRMDPWLREITSPPLTSESPVMGFTQPKALSLYTIAELNL